MIAPRPSPAERLFEAFVAFFPFAVLVLASYVTVLCAIQQNIPTGIMGLAVSACSALVFRVNYRAWRHWQERNGLKQ